MSESYLTGRLDTMLGGRAAERVVFNEVTTGAESDLKQATTLARRMIGLWGMSDEVGPVYLGTGEEHVFLGREIVQERAFSSATATKLDKAVRDLIEGALERAIAMVELQRPQMDALIAALLEKETLDASRSPRSWAQDPRIPCSRPRGVLLVAMAAGLVGAEQAAWPRGARWRSGLDLARGEGQAPASAPTMSSALPPCLRRPL